LYSCVISIRILNAPLVYSVATFHEPTRKPLYFLLRFRISSPANIICSFSKRKVLQSEVLSPRPTPNLEGQVSAFMSPGDTGLSGYTPKHKVVWLYPQTQGGLAIPPDRVVWLYPQTQAGLAIPPDTGWSDYTPRHRVV
jgi:hypothetical protein